jgi:hypothetical protein
MAYLLFKYIRRKNRERQAAKTNDGMPDLHEQELEHKPEELETLGGGSTPTSHPQRSQTVELSAEENARIAAETKRRRIRRWKMVIGLLLPNFLAAVDVTIVAPAVPRISSHFSMYTVPIAVLSDRLTSSDHLSGSFNWIVAAYTLTLTTFVPISGQIADIYGRHSALQWHMFWILIGSVLCASSVTWGMLLFGRALQGLGAAGVMNLTRIILSDNVSLADNSKNNTIFSLVGGIRYVSNFLDYIHFKCRIS